MARSVNERKLSDRDCPMVGRSGVRSVAEMSSPCSRQSVLSTSLDSVAGGDDLAVSWIVVTVGDGCCLGGGVVERRRRSRMADAGPCSDRLPLEPLERR